MVLPVAADLFRMVPVLSTEAGFDASFPERQPALHKGVRKTLSLERATGNRILKNSHCDDKQLPSTRVWRRHQPTH